MYVDIISRESAKRLGLEFFKRPEACKNGHYSERLTSNGRCVACTAERKELRALKDRKPNWLTKSELIE